MKSFASGDDDSKATSTRALNIWLNNYYPQSNQNTVMELIINVKIKRHPLFGQCSMKLHSGYTFCTFHSSTSIKCHVLLIFCNARERDRVLLSVSVQFQPHLFIRKICTELLQSPSCSIKHLEVVREFLTDFDSQQRQQSMNIIFHGWRTVGWTSTTAAGGRTKGKTAGMRCLNFNGTLPRFKLLWNH